MPVTAKPSRRFYERLGDELTNELVDWFNMVDTTYRSELREYNELNFSRFDSGMRKEFAELGVDLARRFAALEARIDARFTAFEARLFRWFVALLSTTFFAVVGVVGVVVTVARR
ncbi:MAG: hypothetical protein ACHQSE_09355 [Gemmatimonadales bacterium]